MEYYTAMYDDKGFEGNRSAKLMDQYKKSN